MTTSGGIDVALDVPLKKMRWLRSLSNHYIMSKVSSFLNRKKIERSGGSKPPSVSRRHQSKRPYGLAPAGSARFIPLG